MSSSSGPSLSTSHIEELRYAVEKALSSIDIPERPESLYDPVRYVLEGGGKRLRPILVILSAQTFGASTAEAMNAALAVEVFHNFTLVHDDIMDNSDTRRGRDAVHVRWDEPTAILAGDYLMAMSYRLLSRAPASVLADLLAVYDSMVTRLCEGQALDKHFETIQSISRSDYLSMIDSKTGALLQACLEVGGIIGGASLEDRKRLSEAGLHLGRAFQIQDDLLDLVADDARWGKTVGSDLVEGKKTFLLVSALEKASGLDRELFEAIVERKGLHPEQVPQAREIMDRIGILDEARSAVESHTGRALELIHSLSASTSARGELEMIVSRLSARPH